MSAKSRTGWQDANFLQAPTSSKVIEFLQRYMADNRIPRQIRTDPGTVLTSTALRQFSHKYGIRHIYCPLNDHKSNGKVECPIRTINQLLRTNKNRVLEKGNIGLSEMLYTLRVARGSKNSCSAELHDNRKILRSKILFLPNQLITTLF